MDVATSQQKWDTSSLSMLGGRLRRCTSRIAGSKTERTSLALADMPMCLWPVSQATSIVGTGVTTFFPLSRGPPRLAPSCLDSTARRCTAPSTDPVHHDGPSARAQRPRSTEAPSACRARSATLDDAPEARRDGGLTRLEGKAPPTEASASPRCPTGRRRVRPATLNRTTALDSVISAGLSSCATPQVSTLYPSPRQPSSRRTFDLFGVFHELCVGGFVGLVDHSLKRSLSRGPGRPQRTPT